jgi:hypothetical protein
VQQNGSLRGFRLISASFWLLLVMLCVIISNIEGCAHFNQRKKQPFFAKAPLRGGSIHWVKGRAPERAWRPGSPF